jgi:acetylornithine deacetylase/succinyl-diaminopimelate desuccinylase-like protein
MMGIPTSRSSNAHGPNESCDIDFMFNLIAAMSQIIVDHYPAKCKKD